MRRLYRILTLRRLGLSLAGIRAVLDQGADDLGGVVRWHLEQIERQIAAQSRLAERLRQVLVLLERMEQPSADSLVQLMEAMTMLERYLSPEQMAHLKERRRALGDETGERTGQEWAALIADTERARQTGLDPMDSRVQELAHRWRELIDRITGSDQGILLSLKTMIEAEGVATASRGLITPELQEYMSAAFAGMPAPPGEMLSCSDPLPGASRQSG